MSSLRLALASIGGHAFRSGAVVTCALLIAGFALFTALLMRGASESLQLALDRLGADILVVPAGSEANIETALLMGNQTRAWMPADTAGSVAAIDGIESVSPQLYLGTLAGASCCSVGDMLIIAFDPATDFTIQPWLRHDLGGDLRLGEVVGGMYIGATEGTSTVTIYGTDVTLRANLAPTGTGMDETLFMSFETASEIARQSVTKAVKPLEIPADSISAALVKVRPGASVSLAAHDISARIPGVVPIMAGDLFRSYRQQMNGLMSTMAMTLVLTGAISLVLVGLVFAIAANERRRELGVLRAMGASRSYVVRTLLAEALILGTVGGLTGTFLVVIAARLFDRLLVMTLGIPFRVPSLAEVLTLSAVGMVLTVGAVGLAALAPALRVSRQQPSEAMRDQP